PVHGRTERGVEPDAGQLRYRRRLHQRRQRHGRRRSAWYRELGHSAHPVAGERFPEPESLAAADRLTRGGRVADSAARPHPWFRQCTANPSGIGSKRECRRVKVAVPEVIERRSMRYRTSSVAGTSALIIVRPPWPASVPSTRPRRDERSPRTVPRCSSGSRIVTSSKGSSVVMRPFAAASFKASAPAVWNAASEEST